MCRLMHRELTMIAKCIPRLCFNWSRTHRKTRRRLVVWSIYHYSMFPSSKLPKSLGEQGWKVIVRTVCCTCQVFFFAFRLYRVTKCHFHKYGPSGTIQRHDVMCVLALNIINEKIYIFLWFWYIILAVLTALYLIYTLAVIAIPSMRQRMVRRNTKSNVKVRKPS